MTSKIIKTVNLKEELEKCKDHTGKMIKIPILSSIREVDGNLVCEIEGYTEVTDDLFSEDKSIFH